MTEPGAGLGEEGTAGLDELLAFIRDSRGFDFTGYKPSSLVRRVRKRMREVGVDGFFDYRDRLESDPSEFGDLFNTILINVTGFFRDPESWTYLQGEVLPDLLTSAASDDEIRVWSTGCASGEEAYSLAMLFGETLGLAETVERVKIYGTDVDDDALRHARTGMYPAKAVEALGDELRDRYFEPAGDRYAFRPDLRRRVIFGRHDVTRDAPISRLDLLVCRNTLMYFNVETQTRILDRFRFALREGGYLFLGKAEMLLADGERFNAASMRHRLFRRRPGAPAAGRQDAPVAVDAVAPADVREVNRKRQLTDLALEASPYAMLVVDVAGTVVASNQQMRGMFGLTGNDTGRPLHDLEVSYRPVELSSLIEQAHAEHRAVRLGAVERTVSRDEVQFVDIHVQPLWAGDGLTVGALVVFVDTTASTRLQLEVKRNREELESAYEELRSTNGELETTNEELQSSIEELETTNEELQSTNEELETTNEELQSTNEELETTNVEMSARTSELEEARAFLDDVLSSVAAAVVVLDADLLVRSWNRGAEELWGLRADEVLGRGFFNLDFGLPTAKLRELVAEAFASGQRGTGTEVDAVNRIGRTITCSVVCSPLATERDDEGIVLLIEDVSTEPRRG